MLHAVFAQTQDVQSMEGELLVIFEPDIRYQSGSSIV